MKAKIAISLDSALLSDLDRRIEGSMLQSRSQAIEYYLRLGLQNTAVTTAVILLHRRHHVAALSAVDGTTLLQRQLNWFASQGMSRAYIVTQRSPLMTRLLVECSAAPLSVEVVEAEVRGNADALAALKHKLSSPFVVMSGDTLNLFDLRAMVSFHQSQGAIATMGLMDRQESARYGQVILDGNRIVSFAEKVSGGHSHVVNAGIYVFSPRIFPLLSGSLEKDVFPDIAKKGELVGHFTRGRYIHIAERN